MVIGERAVRGGGGGVEVRFVVNQLVGVGVGNGWMVSVRVMQWCDSVVSGVCSFPVVRYDTRCIVAYWGMGFERGDANLC